MGNVFKFFSFGIYHTFIYFQFHFIRFSYLQPLIQANVHRGNQVTAHGQEKIGTQKIKNNRLFLLYKSQEFQKQYKVNEVKQQQNVLIHIANDIKK